MMENPGTIMYITYSTKFVILLLELLYDVYLWGEMEGKITRGYLKNIMLLLTHGEFFKLCKCVC